jgi:hypothetical protein
MSVRSYAGLLGDGRALEQFSGQQLSGDPLGAGGLPAALLLLSALQSAAAYSALGAPLHASTAVLLEAPLRVSLLLSNPFIVCREGAHGPVYTAAAVLCGLFVCGLPLLGLAAQRQVQLSAQCARATPHLQELHKALSQPDLLRRLSWFQSLEQALVALLCACTVLSQGTESGAVFTGLQALSAGSALAVMLCVLRVQPWGRGAARWKAGATAALLLLTAVASLMAVARGAAGAGGGSASSEAGGGGGGGAAGPASASSSLSASAEFILCICLLLLAAAVMLLVAYSWLRALLREARRKRMVAHAEELQAQGLFQSSRLPLLLQEGGEEEEEGGHHPAEEAAAAAQAPPALQGGSGKAGQQEAFALHSNPLFCGTGPSGGKAAPTTGLTTAAALEAVASRPPALPPPLRSSTSSPWRLEEVAQPVPVRRVRALRPGRGAARAAAE